MYILFRCIFLYTTACMRPIECRRKLAHSHITCGMRESFRMHLSFHVVNHFCIYCMSQSVYSSILTLDGSRVGRFHCVARER